MKPPAPHRITSYILLTQLISSIAGVGIISCFALYLLYNSGKQDLIGDAAGLSYAISNGLEEPFAALYRNQAPVPAEAAAQIDQMVRSYLVGHPHMRYAVYLKDGTRFTGSLPLEDATVVDGSREKEIDAALAFNYGHTIRKNDRGEWMFYSAVSIDHGCEVYGVLQLGKPFDHAMEPTWRIMTYTGLVSGLIMLAILLLGWQGGVFLSRPVIHLSQVAERLSQGDLTARAYPTGPREIIHLGHTLNIMAGRLQASLEALKAFAGNASHELRTPLTTLKLHVGALRSGALDEPEVAERFLQQIECEVDGMTDLINEMLELSALESNGHSISFTPVDMLELAGEVKSFWEARSRQTGLALYVEHEPNLPQVKGDTHRLRRLCDNLIENAIKHTPRGGQVGLILRSAANPTRLRLEVRDNGVGISPEHLPKIFERFYRVDQPGRRSGSGLGLAIARSIVQVHGGEIGVESAVGKGSTFWVVLPAWS